MATLYELSYEEQRLLNAIDDENFSQEDLIILFEKTKTEKKEKFASYIKVIETLQADEQQLKEHIEKTKSKKDRILKQIDKLKKLMLQSMEMTQDKKINTTYGVVTYNKGRPSCVIKDVNLVPKEYQTVKEIVEVDKNKILETFKTNGELVDGTDIEFNPFVTIK